MRERLQKDQRDAHEFTSLDATRPLETLCYRDGRFRMGY
jgi:hypothetical protein